MDSDEVDPGPVWSVGDSEEEEDDALMTAFSEAETTGPESPGSSQSQDAPTVTSIFTIETNVLDG